MNEKEKRIIRETEELYAKYGIKSVTMEDVASCLGISKKTLYQFVNDKNELVEKVVKNGIEDKLTEFRAIFSEEKNAIEELFELNLFIKQLFKEHNPAREYDLLKYYPELHREFRNVKRKNIYDAFKGNIEKGQRQGLYRKEVNAELMARLHVFRVENIAENDLFDRDEIISHDFCMEILQYHIRGIGTEKGLKYLEKNY
ncbi:MAG: TetR/AcrR family transcriptional regulator [Bacteroidota bacterium]|nr:TetR/AcrR family transcriptional regulator [Bacteroidota bacterium]